MTPTVQAIAWTLIHFCWQAAAIAAAYRALSLLAARRSSNTRYLLALGALLLMLGASVATFAFELRANASSTTAAAAANALENYTISPVTTPPAGASEATATGSAAAFEHSPPSGQSTFALPVLPISALRFIDSLWLIGVLALSLRSLGGWWLIQRLRATATVEAPEQVQASFRVIAKALKIHQPVLLRVSSAVTGPVTVG